METSASFEARSAPSSYPTNLAPLDKALLAILTPLWAASFALTVHTALRPVHFSLLLTSVPATADAAPRVAAFRPYLRGETALRRGDLLLRLGDRDLRGVNPVEFQALVVGQTRAEPFRVEFERAGERAETHLPLASLRAPDLALLSPRSLLRESPCWAIGAPARARWSAPASSELRGPLRSCSLGHGRPPVRAGPRGDRRSSAAVPFTLTPPLVLRASSCSRSTTPPSDSGPAPGRGSSPPLACWLEPSSTAG